MENTLKSNDGTFTFENGKSYAMKFKRTTVLHVYEKQGDWYRTEWVTAKNHEYHGYINFEQLPARYAWFKNLGNGKMICTEIPEAEVKAREAAYNTWAIAEEKAKEAKYKKKF